MGFTFKSLRKGIGGSRCYNSKRNFVSNVANSVETKIVNKMTLKNLKNYHTAQAVFLMYTLYYTDV